MFGDVPDIVLRDVSSFLGKGIDDPIFGGSTLIEGMRDAESFIVVVPLLGEVLSCTYTHPGLDITRVP